MLQGLTTLHLCMRGFSFLEAEGAKRFSSLQRLQDLQLDNVMMSPATLAGLLAALPQLQALSLSIKFATEVRPSTAKDMSWCSVISYMWPLLHALMTKELGDLEAAAPAALAMH